MARFRRTDLDREGERPERHPVPSEEERSPDPGREEFICCVREEIRSLVGGHYYFILVTRECTTLCRVQHPAGERPAHEVMDHEGHGISDDDLHHAVRMRVGHQIRPGYYEISDHIERKLRALLDA